MKSYPIPPWQPESHESVKARFAEALTPDYDLLAVAADRQEPPGVNRKHVFDFEEGVRMIVSTDRDGNGARLFHLSFGLPPHSPLSPHQLPALAAAYVADLIGLAKPVEIFMTDRAFHIFAPPKPT